MKCPGAALQRKARQYRTQIEASAKQGSDRFAESGNDCPMLGRAYGCGKLECTRNAQKTGGGAWMVRADQQTTNTQRRIGLTNMGPVGVSAREEHRRVKREWQPSRVQGRDSTPKGRRWKSIWSGRWSRLGCCKRYLGLQQQWRAPETRQSQNRPAALNQ